MGLTASAVQRLLRAESGGKETRVTLPSEYPAYAPDLIRTVVTVAHFDLAKLKELVDAHPQLVKAAWDWGFGDSETPLGAACHMGRRDIADYLMAKGATPSLFSWVMLGDLHMVQQIVEQRPGIQRVAGPHSISLLAHARMGGKQAQPVLEYLRSLGDADGEKPVQLTAQERASACGSYRLGPAKADMVEVSDDMHAYENSPMYTYTPQLNWTREGMMGRPLFHVGGGVFYPAGARSVEIRFARDAGVEVMTIRDGGTVLSAPKDAR